jgi:outer membrane protein OmpA-like peptidoglycan-associated protein
MDPGRSLADFDPIRITGYSDQWYRFDIDLGKPSSYEEEFDFIFHLASGDTVEYRGRSWGALEESPELDRQRVAAEIREVIEKEKIRDATVDVGDKGVTITLENIQFPPDSDYLMPGEREKLRTIGRILGGYERDILIVGHTARVGTEESCQVLSEDRARRVGEFLLSIGAKTDEEIVIQGMGSREPIGDNSTEEGRQRNRRVEITILEN